MKKDKKTKTITGLTYSGKVNLKVIKGNKVIKTIPLKNYGKPLLFRVVAQALCGFPTQTLVPRYLNFGKISGGAFETLLATRVSVTGRVVESEDIMTNSQTNPNDNDTAYGALFTGYITSTNILNKDNLSEATLAFSLNQNYVDTQGNSTELAILELDANAKKELINSILSDSTGSVYSIMVEWLMVFQDSHKQTSSGSTSANQSGDSSGES